MLEDYQAEGYRIQFDNLLDMIHYVTETPRKWMQESSRDTSMGREWTLGANWSDALRLAREGWEEGIQKLSALSAVVPNEMLATREHNVFGHYPDVPRALSGDPFNMVKRGRSRVPKPTMTVVVSYGANCNVHAETMWNYGAALTALIDRLESRHVRVEVIACWCSTQMGGDKWFTCSHTVKRAEDPLDLSAVAFSLAHPAMLRRIAFAVMERSPKEMERSHYGVSTSSIGPKNLINAPEGEGALYIGGVGSSNDCKDMDKALKYVKDRLEEAAGEPIAELEVVE